MIETARLPLTLTAGEIAEAAGGALRRGSPGVAVGGFATDSRSVKPGELFIALKGDRFDGGAFVDASLSRGACGAIVRRGTSVDDAAAIVIEVADTLTALQELGRYVRRLSSPAVVAITGSAGKTSTKEATADFLEGRYTVYRNAGNLNNHIGLPLSLLELRGRPDVAVVELGMNHAGEIRRLVELAEPDVRVWTNVGDAHAGHFASLEAIADAKAEVLEGATPATRAVVNRDDPRVMARLEAFAGTVTTFGLSDGASVRAADVRDRGVSGTEARLCTEIGETPIRVPMPGRGPLLNVLAAAAVALGFGVPLDAIAERAGRLTAAARRGEVTRLSHDVTLVDDSYNSSPAALAGALEALGSAVARRRIAVLGEMRELGSFALPLHEESGRRAAAAGVDVLIAIGGPPAFALADAARAAGLAAGRVHHWESSAEAAEAVARLVEPGDVVLVKGSRGTRTDIIADRIKAEWA